MVPAMDHIRRLASSRLPAPSPAPRSPPRSRCPSARCPSARSPSARSPSARCPSARSPSARCPSARCPSSRDPRPRTQDPVCYPTGTADLIHPMLVYLFDVWNFSVEDSGLVEDLVAYSAPNPPPSPFPPRSFCIWTHHEPLIYHSAQSSPHSSGNSDCGVTGIYDYGVTGIYSAAAQSRPTADAAAA